MKQAKICVIFDAKITTIISPADVMSPNKGNMKIT